MTTERKVGFHIKRIGSALGPKEASMTAVKQFLLLSPFYH